jgi:catechol 2,3-dioxygenase-like lactoylglutathione lyase family enzyme
MATRLRTLVLRCSDIDRSQRFYSALGLVFEFERHGNGPGHYSTDVGGLVLELYPVDATRAVSGPSHLEFEGGAFERLDREHLPKVLGRPRVGGAGALRFVDPDGRAVSLIAEPTDSGA